jgi:hypothetical protein
MSTQRPTPSRSRMNVSIWVCSQTWPVATSG